MVDIAVCEMEADRAPCRALKLQLIKVMVNKDDFVDLQEYDEAVSIEDAQKAFPDYEAFMKRNRFSEKNTIFLMDRIKNEEDLAVLKPLAKKIPNGWVDLTKLDESKKAEVLSKGSQSDRINAWDNLTFEEMDATCASCPLAWNKGKDCIGTFGPESSKLPEIAQKYNCPIVASAIEAAADHRKFSVEDAKELLRECEVLKPALIDEGKMAAHRYSGPVERMETMAKACIAEGCGFFFI